MNQQTLMNKEVPVEGSASHWNTIWNEEKSRKYSKECLFTNKRIKSIYEFWQRTYAKDLLNLIEGKEYVDFLELGSGRGTTSMYLNQAGYSQITLVDLSEQAKNLASNNFNRFQLKYKDFIIADVRNTLMPNASFDCIYNIGLLEHFNKPDEVLKEAFRLLRPGGLLFMPIFPDRKSIHCYLTRLVFNPLSYVKMMFTSNSRTEEEMIRTKLPLEAYKLICSQLGYTKVECMYYNPFPKIVRDSWYENNIVLNAYKFVHFIRSLRKRKVQFQTTSFFGTAYLLVAYK